MEVPIGKHRVNPLKVRREKHSKELDKAPKATDKEIWGGEGNDDTGRPKLKNFKVFSSMPKVLAVSAELEKSKPKQIKKYSH